MSATLWMGTSFLLWSPLPFLIALQWFKHCVTIEIFGKGPQNIKPFLPQPEKQTLKQTHPFIHPMPQKSQQITFIGQQLSCITHGNVYSVFCVCRLLDQCNSGCWVVMPAHYSRYRRNEGRVFGLFKADVSVAVASLVSNQIRWKIEEGRESSSWGWFLRGCRVTTSNLC